MPCRPSSRTLLVEGLPEGTVSLTRFVVQTRVSEGLITRHISLGHIEVIDVNWGVRRVRYFTPDQQRAAFAYWDKHGIAYRKPVAVRGSEAKP
jgi:hypothetical protein